MLQNILLSPYSKCTEKEHEPSSPTVTIWGMIVQAQLAMSEPDQAGMRGFFAAEGHKKLFFYGLITQKWNHPYRVSNRVEKILARSFFIVEEIASFSDFIVFGENNIARAQNIGDMNVCPCTQTNEAPLHCAY